LKRLIIILLVSVRAMRRNVLRTLLTMLGIIIGVGAVIAVVSIGTGARVTMETQMAAMGQNVVMIMSGSWGRGGVRTGIGGAGTLTLEDAEAIAREVDGVRVLSPEARGNAQVSSGTANWNCQIMGQSEGYLTLRAWPLTDGSFFGDAEVRAAARVAVIGQTTAKKLFEGETSLVGQTIRIKEVPFKVIGLLVPKGANMWGQDQDDIVIVPYTTAMRRLFGQTNLRQINVSASSPTAIERVVNETTDLLRQRHRITGEREDDFMIRTQQELTDLLTSQSRLMTRLLTWVAVVSLLVGGIGIMNIMLVSVTERTREIGIRLAVGAKRRDVLRQFLAEAVIVTMIGGMLGIGAGIGGSALIAKLANWPTITPFVWIAVAFVGSAFMGIIFGLFPAMKASWLDPIEALRYE
jgi:putative ABC transport system permease protein